MVVTFIQNPLSEKQQWGFTSGPFVLNLLKSFSGCGLFCHGSSLNPLLLEVTIPKPFTLYPSIYTVCWLGVNRLFFSKIKSGSMSVEVKFCWNNFLISSVRNVFFCCCCRVVDAWSWRILFFSIKLPSNEIWKLLFLIPTETKRVTSFR